MFRYIIQKCINFKKSTMKIKKSFFLIFLLVFTALSLVAQPRKVIFYDNFTDNRNNWDEINNRVMTVKIRNGKYVITHRRMRGMLTTVKNIPFVKAKNIGIKTTLKKHLGVNNHGYGLIWGWKDRNNYRVFLISGNGEYQIGAKQNGVYRQITPWRHSKIVHRNNKTNTLEIKKIGNKLYYFINQQYITNTPFVRPAGNKAGFVVNRNISIAAEDISIYRITPQEIRSLKKLFQNKTTISPVTDKMKPDNRKPSYPPDLSIQNIEFREPSGNQALDADEAGKLYFDLYNQGRGKAEKITIRITAIPANSQLDCSSKVYIQQLLPDTHKRIEIPVKAKTGIKSQMQQLRIEINETNGFDADPALITFETVAYAKPDLKIQKFGIKDSNDENGDSYGNGNSIIEPGESVEVIAFVQNFGKGKAKDVSATVLLNTENKNITCPDAGKHINLGDIESGDYKKIAFYFYTSRRYNEKEIPLYIKLLEAKSKTPKTIALHLKLNERTSNIVEVDVESKQSSKTELEIKEIEEIIEWADVDKDIPVTNMDGENILTVIIGIEDYKYAPKVDYANRDALIFYKYMKNMLGIPERNIFYRTNEGATSGEFQKVFTSNGWLDRRIKDSITSVIVFYAGHGAPDLKTGNSFLIPYDVDPNYANTGFRLDRMYQSLASMQAKSVTVFLDACFSGVSRSSEMLVQGARSVKIKPPEPENKSDNLTVLSASANDQYGSAFPEKKHGLFTYFLLKGIRGEARTNHVQLTLQELHNYVQKNVQETAAYLDKEQTPTISGKNKSMVFITYN